MRIDNSDKTHNMYISEDQFKQLLEDWQRGDFSDVFYYLTAVTTKEPFTRWRARVEALFEEYQRMKEFWMKGYKDEEIDRVFDRMRTKVFGIIIDHYRLTQMEATLYLKQLNYEARRQDAQQDFMSTTRENLEKMESDIALLGLEGTDGNRNKINNLYRRRNELLKAFFGFVFSSLALTDGEKAVMKDFLLTPTLDTIDRQVIVAALMMSSINYYDPLKLRLLLEVYLESHDEAVKQRALVALVFSLDSDDWCELPGSQAVVNELLAVDGIDGVLVELQMELLSCMDTATVGKTIAKEVMPDILSGTDSQLQIGPNGMLEEKAEDPMNDILGTGDAEEKAERVEKAMNRLNDMRASGADIYFAGFSKMKRYAFFSNMANWFMPFYKDNPELGYSDIPEGGRRLLNALFAMSAFCDSDKYSFALSLKTIIGKLSESILQAMGHSNMEIPGQNADGQKAPDGAAQRRSFLQDVYRFCNLFDQRKEFNSLPLKQVVVDEQSKPYLFFANPVLRNAGLPVEAFLDIARLLVKRGSYKDAALVLANVGERGRDNFGFYMLDGYLKYRAYDAVMDGGKNRASESFANALRLRPDDHKALLAMARALYKELNYKEALEYYNRLIAGGRGNVTAYKLYACLSMVYLGRYDEALNMAYRLDYETPGDRNTRRVLARALTGNHRYEEALKIYDEPGMDTREDLQARAFCEWFMGRNADAVEHFKTVYAHLLDDRKYEREEAYDILFRDLSINERTAIERLNIKRTEIHLMVQEIMELDYNDIDDEE